MQIINKNNEIFANNFRTENSSWSFVKIVLDVGLYVLAGSSGRKVDLKFHVIIGRKRSHVVRNDDRFSSSRLSYEHAGEFLFNHQI